MASPRIVAANREIPIYLLQSDISHQDDEDGDENKDEDVDNDNDVGVLKMHLPNLISQSTWWLSNALNSVRECGFEPKAAESKKRLIML